MDRMDQPVQHAWAQRVVYAVNTLFPLDPKEQVDTWPLCLRYLEQVQACSKLMQQQPIEALSLYQQALAIREQALGTQHPKTTEIREYLRAILQALGK